MTCRPCRFRVAVVGVFVWDFGCAGSCPRRQRLCYAIVVVKRLAEPEGR